MLDYCVFFFVIVVLFLFFNLVHWTWEAFDQTNSNSIEFNSLFCCWYKFLMVASMKNLTQTSQDFMV